MRVRNNLVIVGSISIVILTIIISLASLTYFQIPIFGHLPGGRDATKKYFQLADAIEKCDTEITDELGERIYTKTFDGLSNRYDSDKNAFYVYAELGLRSDSGKDQIYVVCKMSAATLKMDNFEIYYRD